MSVGISIWRKDIEEVVNSYTIGGAAAIETVWIPIAMRAGLEILSKLGTIMGFHDSNEISELRQEFVTLRNFIVANNPTELAQHKYPLEEMITRIDHIIGMLDAAIENDLRVHSS